MALTIVEVDEERQRQEDPEAWQEQRTRELQALFAEVPGPLVRDHEAEDVTVPDDGDQ
jgi:hypothetical protein